MTRLVGSHWAQSVWQGLCTPSNEIHKKCSSHNTFCMLHIMRLNKCSAKQTVSNLPEFLKQQSSEQLTAVLQRSLRLRGPLWPELLWDTASLRYYAILSWCIMTSLGGCLLNLWLSWLDWAQWQPSSCTQRISPVQNQNKQSHPRAK